MTERDMSRAKTQSIKFKGIVENTLLKKGMYIIKIVASMEIAEA